MLATLILSLTELDKLLAAHSHNMKLEKLFKEAQSILLREAADKLEGVVKPLTDKEIMYLKAGEKIQAIKAYRERTGAGLAAGKDYIEREALNAGLAYYDGAYIRLNAVKTNY